MSVLELLKSDPKTTPNLMEKLKKALDQETSLDFTDQELTPSQLINLFKALEENETVMSLNMSYKNKAGFRDYMILSHAAGLKSDAVLNALASMLVNNRTITDLNLKKNGLSVWGAEILAPALKQNQGLRSLNLIDNYLMDEGIAVLSQALESNQNLERLYLGKNAIKAEGAQALAQALENNVGLLHLDLESNRITEEGAQKLASALEKNKNLASLSLKMTVIGDKGVIAIAEALKKNQSLIRLDLSEIGSPREAFRKLADALEINKTLLSLEYDQTLAAAYSEIFNDINSCLAINKAEAYKAQSEEIMENTSFPRVIANTISEYVDLTEIRDLPAPSFSNQLPENKKPVSWSAKIIQLLEDLWHKFSNFVKEKLGFKKNNKKPLTDVSRFVPKLPLQETSSAPSTTILPKNNTQNLSASLPEVESKKRSKEVKDLITRMKKKLKKADDLRDSVKAPLLTRSQLISAHIFMDYKIIVEDDLAILNSSYNLTDAEKTRMEKALDHLSRQITYFGAEKQNRIPPIYFPLLSLKEAKEEQMHSFQTYSHTYDALVLILIAEMENEQLGVAVDLNRVSRLMFELKNLTDISRNNSRKLTP